MIVFRNIDLRLRWHWINWRLVNNMLILGRLQILEAITDKIDVIKVLGRGRVNVA